MPKDSITTTEQLDSLLSSGLLRHAELLAVSGRMKAASILAATAASIIWGNTDELAEIVYAFAKKMHAEVDASIASN